MLEKVISLLMAALVDANDVAGERYYEKRRKLIIAAMQLP